MRDGLGVRAERGGVELAIVGGLLLDPVLGVRRTQHRHRRRARRRGRPRRQPGHDGRRSTSCSTPRPRSSTRRGLIVTPGGDRHRTCTGSRRRSRRRARRRPHDAGDPGLRPGLEPRLQPGRGPARRPGRRSRPYPLNAALLVRGSSSRPGPVEDGAARRRRRAEDPRGRRRRARADPHARSTSATRHDVQLAIHTDGLNEALSVEDTLAAFGGRTVHAFHIEGAGGGHAPDLLALAGRERVLDLVDHADRAVRRRTPRPSTSRWSPAVHVLAPGGAPATATALRAARARRARWPPRACCTTSA